MKKILKQRKTFKAVSNQRLDRRVKQSRRKKSLSDINLCNEQQDKGFLSSTEYEIESRKIHYGYFDRY